MSQCLTLVNLALRSTTSRPGMCSVVVLGIAGVVVVYCFLRGMTVSLADAIVTTGSPDRVIVLRRGSGAEIASSLSRNEIDLIANAPGVASYAGNRSLVSAETVRSLNLKARGIDAIHSFPIRGVSSVHELLRPEVRIEEGRMFRTGAYELIVGRQVLEHTRGTRVGDQIKIRGVAWEVVGVFSALNSVHESELLADLDTLQSLYQMRTVNSLTVKLEDHQSFDAFRGAVESIPGLGAVVQRETDYYQAQAEQATLLLRVVVSVVGTIMAFGVILASANAMYSAVSARKREIGILRAIGYGNGSVLTSVIVESMLLALFGAVIGAALAFLLFQNNLIATSTGYGLTQTAFRLGLTPGVLIEAIAGGMAIGALGGMAPGFRAIHISIDRASKAYA